MVMMVLWGLVSPQLLQKVMALYQADLKLLEEGKLDLKGIEKLAKIGTNGTLPNSCWRDLKAILPAVKLPSPKVVLFPLKHTNLGKFAQRLPLLLPHTLFAAIYNHFPEMWQKIVYPGALTFQRFWKAVSGSPQFAQHDVK